MIARYILVVICLLAVCSNARLGLAQEPKKALPLSAPAKAALAYIARERDRFHTPGFILYDDHASGGCHMFPSLWMGDLEPPEPEPAWVKKIFDERWATKTAEGPHCLRVEYPKELARGGQNRWVACGWQSHEEKDKRVAYNLSRYVFPGERPMLSLQARGERGNEKAEFRLFKTDSVPFRYTLRKEWGKITLPIPGGALNDPISECFVWSTKQDDNPAGAVFYLDNIRIEFGPKGQALRLAEPRFVRSFFAESKDMPDRHFRNVCFSYDQALAISALVAAGEMSRAKLIADAFVYAIENDRYFRDHRVRNAYMCGDIAGLGARGIEGPARMPGWWDFQKKQWFEDAYYASSDCGNSAYVILGLLNYWQASGKQPDSIYLKTAVRLGEWIDKNAFTKEGGGGFHGGLEGFEPAKKGDPVQVKSPWRSTEHAIDLYAAYQRLADATRNPRFRALAEHADQFVASMWNKKEAHLYTGTKDDGVSINTKPIPLDVHAWSLLSFRDAKRFGPAVEWAAKNCRVPLGPKVAGYDFDTDRDAVWWEGTGQMCVAFRFLGKHAEADAALHALRSEGVVKLPHPAHGGVYAASGDGLTTGFHKVWTPGGKEEPWLYYRRPHLGATCWHLFAELDWNPYWGEPINRE